MSDIDDMPNATTIAATLSQARERHDSFDFSWGFALVPYAIEHDERVGVHDPVDPAMDYIGVRTLRGELVPLTSQMCHRLEQIVWWRGDISAALSVPGEMGLLEKHDPLPYVDVFATPGPTTPMPQDQQPAHRIALYCSMDAQDVGCSKPIFIVNQHPDGWPR